MSDPTLSAIAGVAQDVRDLRTDITGRLDQMVTRREHVAEIKRLDEADKGQRDALARHEEAADARLLAIGEKIDEAERVRAAAVEAAAKRRTEDRRWLASWGVAAIVAAVGITQLIASFLR